MGADSGGGYGVDGGGISSGGGEEGGGAGGGGRGGRASSGHGFRVEPPLEEERVARVCEEVP